MKTFKLLQIAVILIVMISISACIKDNDFDYDKIAQSSWNPDVAVPLIHSDLGIEDIIGISDSTSFSVGNDHLVTLIYRGNIYSILGRDLIPVVDQTDNVNFTMTGADSIAITGLGATAKTTTHTLPFIFPGGESIDSMTIKAGWLLVNLNSTVPHSGIFNVTIPAATKNGQALNMDINFTYFGSPVSRIDSIDLSGYKINLSATGNPNQLDLNYAVGITNTGSGDPIINTNTSATVNFKNISFESIYGNVGQKNINLFEDSSRITLFDNFSSGNLYFEDPKMTFSLSNSFGMPIDAHATSLAAIGASGNLIAFTGAIPNPLPVNYPAAAGQVATSSFTLDKTNSNIQAVIGQAPRYIVYSLNATSNLPAPTYNFMLDTSSFKADIQIDFPLRGYASGFTVQDTAPFQLEKIDEIESAVFRINIDNGYPASAFTQVYFTDSNYVVLDSILSNPQNLVIESAQIDANGRVTTHTRKTTDEPFSNARLQHLYTAKKVLIRSVLDTKDSPARNIEIYDDYRLDVKIGVRAQLNVKFQ